ncbi:MAG: hypothetical protein J07AB43_01020 [Candidatus Nanosalina sp. J07AB43]|jgi:hypothetical protein|nr:MAG: hypothetical protein J07AB43_01020 [Candidatus Nanosalina sp. J07AB43]
MNIARYCAYDGVRQMIANNNSASPINNAIVRTGTYCIPIATMNRLIRNPINRLRKTGISNIMVVLLQLYDGSYTT